MDGDDNACRDALAILQDVVQLCELLRGRKESCSFHSACSDTFNMCAMGHLCAQDPAKSVPCRQLLPFIDRFLPGGRGEDSQADMNGRKDEDLKTAAAAAAATEAAKLSMALAEERRAGMAELQAKLYEKEQETQALLNKNAALTRALEEKQGQSKSLGASFVQSGVQMIPSSELDLDLPNKEVLGTGVYSEVYKTVRQVALKALKGRFSQQRFREFKHEAEILQLVQGSSGVCRLHGICIDSLPNLYLVTEPILGGTLEVHLQQMQSKGIPLDRAFAIARSIASAMKDVHAKGIVHRDLKPSNCVLTTYDNKSVKLVDFGLARVVQGDFISAEEHDGAGTPMYQAPEILRNSGVGLPSDVFSFGIIMWEIISGEIAYEGLSLEDMKMAVLAGARPPVKPTWNAQWAEIMRACWSDHPAKRPTFGALEEMLSRLTEQHATGGAQQSTPVAHPDASTVHKLVQQAANAVPQTIMPQTIIAKQSPQRQQQPQPQMAAAGRQLQGVNAQPPPGGQYQLSMQSPRGPPPVSMAPPQQNAHHPSHQASPQPPPLNSPLPHAAHPSATQLQQSSTDVRNVAKQVAAWPPQPTPLQQTSGAKLSPSIKTMAGPQFGGVVQDMEEM